MLLLSLLLMLHLSKLAAIAEASVNRAVQLAGSEPATETSEGKLVSLPSSSVEARGLAFFPDHEPNTCPSLQVSVPGGLDVKVKG